MSAFPFLNTFTGFQELHRAPESSVVTQLLDQARGFWQDFKPIQDQANQWSLYLREQLRKSPFIETLMNHYHLSSKEGLLMMALAEALLRIEDSTTAAELIKDKLTQGDFKAYLGQSPSILVNLTTSALDLLTGSMKNVHSKEGWVGRLKTALGQAQDPVMRQGVLWSMRLLSQKFVMGDTIQMALKRAKAFEGKGYLHSFDMLGEEALTEKDAQGYFTAYQDAIHQLGKRKVEGKLNQPGISVKLSALYPRYEVQKLGDVQKVLVHRLRQLCLDAAKYDLSLTIDAEESHRLEMSLEVLALISGDPDLKEWQGLGLAVQAYQKRATAVIDWLANLAHKHGRRLNVRLVKGAYWDTEIKLAQEQGLKDYPVFTRKASTDLSYLVCARKLLDHPHLFYPAFATHSAVTLAAIRDMAKGTPSYEFQRLHGMGEALYDRILQESQNTVPCRIYAPVGSHAYLLPYLVRRLLENGANSSFVHQLVDDRIPLEVLNANPIETVASMTHYTHDRIPLPRDLYKAHEDRNNSWGVDLSSAHDMDPFVHAALNVPSVDAFPMVGHDTLEHSSEQPQLVSAPFDDTLTVGSCRHASLFHAERALTITQSYEDTWAATPVDERAKILRKAGDLLEERSKAFVALLVTESGKTYDDAIAEVREAVDFCWYYAYQADRLFKEPMVLPGPTGEKNRLYHRGRGTFACISPWNFPLAIFLGQVAAALVSGNCVIAKPATQTPLVAHQAVKLMHEAGIPQDALCFLPMGGQDFAEVVLKSPTIAGVAFTGSVETAWSIQSLLAGRRGPIIPLIAETGGQNAMIVDASALMEQVIKDVVRSAFKSAGQRCSALRVVFVQEDCLGHFKEMLRGAMDMLTIADPRHVETDIGPVIDAKAQEDLLAYCEEMTKAGYLFYQCSTENLSQGSFVPPTVFEIPDVSLLEQERFGPILHVVSFKPQEFDDLFKRINALGFGLTFGLHTRIDGRMEKARKAMKAGNIYINRNMIGAVVGVQPFGGCGLSGTGPKAGGPNYLHAFTTEQAVSINTTAAGGNASLMVMEEGDDIRGQGQDFSMITYEG